MSTAYGQVRPAPPGTYQLMTTNPKVPEVFTTDLREFIQEHRAAHHDVYLKIGQVTWVRIFSQARIDDPGFQPVSEEIVPTEPGWLPVIPATK